jgi:hypothetical protein
VSIAALCGISLADELSIKLADRLSVITITVLLGVVQKQLQLRSSGFVSGSIDGVLWTDGTLLLH